MDREIKLNISRKGEFKAEINNGCGASCVADLNSILAAAGIEVGSKVETKPEYHLPDGGVGVLVNT